MTFSKHTFLAIFLLALAACQRTGTSDAVGEGPAIPPADGAPATSPGLVQQMEAADRAGLPDPGLLTARDTAPTDAKVEGVRLSRDGDGERNFVGATTNRFSTTDTVYAEISTRASQGGYTIYAKWTDSSGSVLSDYGIQVPDGGAQRTVISLSKPDGWERGRHSIEIAVNGRTERTATFEVQ